MIEINNVNRFVWAQNINQFHASIYTDPLWFDALVNNGNEALYLNFVNVDNQIVAKLAGIVIRGNAIKGHQLYFYSAPAFISIDDDLFQQSLESLKSWAINNGFARISIRPWDQLHSLKANVYGFKSTMTHEYEVDLTSSDFDDKSISSRILRNVKKARKAGVLLRRSTSNDDLKLLLLFLHSTHKRRTIKFGNDYSPYYVNLLSEPTIAELLRNGMAELYCADLNGQTQSIMLMLNSGTRTYNLLKGSLDEAYATGASSFLDYEVILSYRQKGFGVLNLGVELLAGIGDGLNQYKEGLGGKRITKLGAYTYYLYFPYTILNIVFYISNLIPDLKWILWTKRQLSKLFSGAQN